MIDSRLGALLRLLDQAYDRRAWHGPNLRNALRGVAPAVAAWRPQPARHNIWEIAVHAAYWKYRVYRLLTDAAPRAFDEQGSDWFERPAGITAAAWQADLGRLGAWHARLLAAVEGFDAARLDEAPGRSDFSFFDLIAGAAAHDVYHAGQVRLLRRMHAETA